MEINDKCFSEQFSYDNASIKPPEKINNKVKDSKVKYVLIDSRDRNYKVYPNSNEYRIDLNEPIKDVTEIELIQAHIPATAYLINNNNNKIHYYIGVDDITAYTTQMHTAIVEVGDWDETNLASRITEAFRANKHDVSVYYDEHINKFSIVLNDEDGSQYTQSPLQLYLDFRNTTLNGDQLEVVNSNYDQNNSDTSYKTGSMGEILGFSKNYYTTDAINMVTFVTDAPDSPDFTVKSYDIDNSLYNPDSNTNPSYFILDKSKSEINVANRNFPITIGSVLKVYNDVGDYMTGVVESFLGVTDDNKSDRVRLTWLSGLNVPEKSFNKITTNISDCAASLGGDDYILLQMPNLIERYEGRNTNVEKSYAKLHLGKSTKNIFFGRIKQYSCVYECNPTIQKLDRLHIKFTDYHGNNYDYNNAENSLIFAITYKTQPNKYDF